MSTTQIAIMTVVVAALVILTSFSVSRMAAAHAGNGGLFSGHRLHRDLMGNFWGDKSTVEKYTKMCKQRGQDRINEFVSHIEKNNKFSPQQDLKWKALIEAATSESETITFVCEKIFNPENHSTTLARLELAESLMATGQESMNRVSPYIKDFYLSLDEQQQQNFDAIFQRHHDRYFLWSARL